MHKKTKQNPKGAGREPLPEGERAKYLHFRLSPPYMVRFGTIRDSLGFKTDVALLRHWIDKDSK